MPLFCPSCSKEITPDTSMCPKCGQGFGLDRLTFLSGEPDEVIQDRPPHERRKQVRFPQGLKVAYATPKAFVENYIFDLSTGGLFINSTEPLDPGEQLNLRIFLPDKGNELEVLGEVMWCNREKKVTPERTFPPGMGVKFLDLTSEGLERIINILAQSLH